ncbi:hypothetical protein [Oceanobacillus neutriphilus]|uniref:hypothetical protein n=1 Tax=Oceanobacillus neutriphilus TaxID=531815 RepID=UPI0016679C59|nr:hypothetical protein [Oceanobacillus neutriphilus]
MKQIYFLIVLICLFVLIGCSQQSSKSEKVLSYQENSEIIGEEKEEIVGEVSDTMYESIDRSNAEAEEFIIGPVSREGEEITPPEGRYNVGFGFSDDFQSGRVLVYDEEDTLLIEALLDDGYGLRSITVDLNGSHTVYTDGVEELILIPKETKSSNELTTGISEVGKDIEPGNYSVATDLEDGIGYLEIFEEGEQPQVFEVLINPLEPDIDVELKEGQKVKITGFLSGLQFEPQS